MSFHDPCRVKNYICTQVQNVQRKLEIGTDTVLVFADMSKAFDRVSHKGLLAKLSSIGIQGQLLRWCESYLSHRIQKVVIGGQESDDSLLTSGVPQGSILGPLFFLVYMNNLPENLNCQVRMYADDVTLMIHYNDPLQAKTQLEENLKLLDQWARTWHMQFNPVKSEILFI